MKKTNLVEVLVKGLFQKGPCISIYIKDSGKVSEAIEKVRALFLKDQKMEIFDLLIEPLKHFVQQKRSLQQKNIAIFLSPYHSFWTELPFIPKDIYVAADSYHVKPILKWMQREKPFYLLRMVDSTASLYLCGLIGMQFEKKFKIKNIPYKQEVDLEDINTKVSDYLYNKNIPLVIAAENVLLGKKFAKECSYEKCIEEIFEAQNLMIQDHKKAILYLEAYYAAEEKVHLERYWQAKPRGQTSNVIHEIVQRALLGQVKHLFINESTHVWGEINHSNGQLIYHEKQMNTKDDDILDDLAQIVLSYRGEVTVLNVQHMPDQRAAVAIFKQRDPSIQTREFSSYFLKMNGVS